MVQRLLKFHMGQLQEIVEWSDGLSGLDKAIVVNWRDWQRSTEYSVINYSVLRTLWCPQTPSALDLSERDSGFPIHSSGCADVNRQLTLLKRLLVCQQQQSCQTAPYPTATLSQSESLYSWMSTLARGTRGELEAT